MWIVHQTFIGLHLRICAPLLKCSCEFEKKEKARHKSFDPRQVDFCFSVLTRFCRWMDTKEEERRLQIVLTFGKKKKIYYPDECTVKEEGGGHLVAYL